MDFSKRIKIDIENESEKYIKFRLDQDTRQLEILSLKLSQDNLYGSFNADFGVVVGRVIANGGVGIPNAKLSIFIPISDEDKENPDLYAIYPYTSPKDVNSEGKRYNLLPRTSRLNSEGSYKPKQPFGSFPNKEEILTNDTQFEIYEKYYKYTTVTNNSGDYMLFGVPIGTQTVHMSVDITDIGEYSMSPIQMIQNLGYSPYLFTEDGINIKPQKLLEDVPNIETQEISVNVIPFWGNSDLFDIGITRQDFKIRAELVSSVIVFGTIGTMGEQCVIGTPDRGDRKNRSFYYLSENVEQNIDIRTLRGSDDLNIRVFTYPKNITKDQIDSDLAYTGTSISDYKDNRNIDPAIDIIELDKSEFYTYVANGCFLLVIPCNRDRIITDEFGQKVPTTDESVGVYSKFLGMCLIDYKATNNLPITLENGNPYYGGDRAYNTRGILKIPQSEYSLKKYTQSENNISDYSDNETKENYLFSEKWRKDYFELELGNYYSISQFFPTIEYNDWGVTNNLSNDGRINDYTIHGFLFKTAGIDYLTDYNHKFDNLNQININNNISAFVFSDDIFSGITTISTNLNFYLNTLRLYATSGNSMNISDGYIQYDENEYSRFLNLNGIGSIGGTKYKSIGLYLDSGNYSISILCSGASSTTIIVDGQSVNVSNSLNSITATTTLNSASEIFIYSTASTNISIYKIIAEKITTSVSNYYDYEFPHNKTYVRDSINEKYFGAQWINLFMILPQFSYAGKYHYDERLKQVAGIFFYRGDRDPFFLEFNTSNNQLIFGGSYKTVNVLRGDTFKTKLIKVPKDDIYTLYNYNSKAINYQDLSLVGDYSYQNPNNSSTSTDYLSAYDDVNKGPYLFKGYYDNDCIKLLFDLNIL